MSFYTELEPFIEYVHSIRKLKNYLSIDLKFPTKWSIPKSIVEEGQVVGFESDDANFKGISFVTEISETSVNVTLTKVAKIIRLNKEKELKEKLFKQTIEQLKQTFEKTDLDKLQNLYFDFDLPDNDLTEDLDDGEPTTLELAEE
jgi:hypothetical protein